MAIHSAGAESSGRAGRVSTLETPAVSSSQDAADELGERGRSGSRVGDERTGPQHLRAGEICDPRRAFDANASIVLGHRAVEHHRGDGNSAPIERVHAERAVVQGPPARRGRPAPPEAASDPPGPGWSPGRARAPIRRIHLVKEIGTRASGTNNPPAASTTMGVVARPTISSMRRRSICLPSASAATIGAAGIRNR